MNNPATTQTIETANPFAHIEMETECAFSAGDDHSEPCNRCATCRLVMADVGIETSAEDLQDSAVHYVEATKHGINKDIPRPRAELRESAVNYTLALLESLGLGDKLSASDVERLTDAAGRL